ncbi:M20 family metallopeptidase [Streptosporangium saharense]|uniref:M20 family metallopeptidase n=1 Tax=Streptosporangium saharense TaxID=1706840 RepID=UPI0036C3BBF7
MTERRAAPSALHERAREAAMIADIERLVRCESPSDDLAAVARSAEAVAELGARYLGAEAERLVVDGRTHLRWRFGREPRVLLLGHHDTVWPLGSLETHPFEVRDGVLRGPGCFDMKAGLVMAFHALAALDTLDGVTLLITGDEEPGSPTSRELVEDEARRCAATLVLEAAGPGGALKTERKGVSRYEVLVRGRAAHAGLEPERGVNAAVELAHQVMAVAALGDPALGTTVTPARLEAGTTVNTVPAAARLAIDVRVRHAAEQHRVHTAMRGLRPYLTGAEVEVVGGPNRPPLGITASKDLFERAWRIAEALGVGPLTSVAVGGASDGNLTAGVGVPTLDGLGAVGGGAHADDEHVITAELPGRTRLLTALTAELLTTANPAFPANRVHPAGSAKANSAARTETDPTKAAPTEADPAGPVEGGLAGGLSGWTKHSLSSRALGPATGRDLLKP